MQRSLSIPDWVRLAEEGAAPPARILLNGSSMFPLVRYQKDYVTIVQLTDAPAAGDIVLFSQNDKYIVHRVWEVREGKILTWGDNCPGPDGWNPPEAILGKVVLIERGSRKIRPDPVKGIKWAKFWHQAGKPYRLCKRYKDGITRRIRKLCMRGTR